MNLRKIVILKKLKKLGSSWLFELVVVSFMQEDAYIRHTASAFTLGLQVFS